MASLIHSSCLTLSYHSQPTNSFDFRPVPVARDKVCKDLQKCASRSETGRCTSGVSASGIGCYGRGKDVLLKTQGAFSTSRFWAYSMLHLYHPSLTRCGRSVSCDAGRYSLTPDLIGDGQSHVYGIKMVHSHIFSP